MWFARVVSSMVANVVDSTAVLAINNPNAREPNEYRIKALVLAKDHKLEDPDETRILRT